MHLLNTKGHQSTGSPTLCSVTNMRPLCALYGLVTWKIYYYSYLVSSVQSLSRVRLFVTPWISARQASLSITISRSSLRLMSIESLMPSSHLILCRPVFLLPPIPPSIRVFSHESALCMRWPKYWSFSCNIIPSKEHLGLISFRINPIYYTKTLKVYIFKSVIVKYYREDTTVFHPQND